MKFNVRVSSWYNSGTTSYPAPNPLSELVNSLSSSFGIIPNSHATTSQLSSSGNFSANTNNFLNTETYDNTKPKAYLNWVLFDDQFNLVSSSSGFDQVGIQGSLKTHQFTNLPINKNGYLYIYVSNQTPGQDVYFDNLQLTLIHGQLIEENHYYPYGLMMSGISDKRIINVIETKFKYNGIELESKFDLNLGESFFRSHDPQLGRWNQIDPKPNLSLSVYSAMGNNPIMMSDQLGDTTWVFNQKGIYLGLVPDKLKNEIHFIKTEQDSGKEIDTKGLNSKQIKALGKAFRNQSFAFIGSNAAKQLQSISDHATKANKEIGFVGTIGPNKEIIFTEMPIDENNKKDEVNLGAQLDKNYKEKAKQSNLFLVGHVHHGGLLNGASYNGGTDIGQHTYLATLTNPDDYGPFLYRSPNAEQRGQSAAILATPYGMEIYGTATNIIYDPVTGSVPINKIYPKNESNILYKSIKK